jgi:hypothetical protein
MKKVSFYKADQFDEFIVNEIDNLRKEVETR